MAEPSNQTPETNYQDPELIFESGTYDLQIGRPISYSLIPDDFADIGTDLEENLDNYDADE